jgi:hypothetical protein
MLAIPWQAREVSKVVGLIQISVADSGVGLEADFEIYPIPYRTQRR